MSTVASIIVPSEVAKAKKEAQLAGKTADLSEARFAADRYCTYIYIIGSQDSGGSMVVMILVVSVVVVVVIV